MKVKKTQIGTYEVKLDENEKTCIDLLSILINEYSETILQHAFASSLRFVTFSIVMFKSLGNQTK